MHCAETLASDGVSLSDAGWGRDGRSGNKGPGHLRRKLPTGRAVLWAPRGSSGSALDSRPTDTRPYEFFIRRSVIAGINRHLDGRDRDPRFGFVLGYACRCPTTGVRYSVADTAIAAREVLVEEASGAFLIRAWAEARSAFADHAGVLLGWYHSHHLLGLTLSESDEEVNERYFSQPWQASIVAVPDSKRGLGGVFRLDPDAGVAERRRPSRFYELHDEPTDAASEASASAVIWTNYEVSREEPIEEPSGESGGESGGASGSASSGALGGEPQARPEMAEPRQEEPHAVSLVIPGDGDEFDRKPVYRRLKLVPLGVFVLVMVIVALVTVVRGLDRTPVMVLPQVRTVRTLDQRQLFAAVDGLSIAIERYDERAIDFDAGRISCDLLATGYAAADAAFMETATSFGVLGGEPGREALDAYETASTEIAVVNTHFDGSGCPRP